LTFQFPAVVNKLIKDIVPNIRVSTDTRDLLLNCCTGIIELIYSVMPTLVGTAVLVGMSHLVNQNSHLHN